MDAVPEPQEVVCVLMIIVTPDGGSQVVLDPTARFNAQRLATPNDVFPALSNIVADWQAMKTAEAVVSFQKQLAQQFAQQAEITKLRQTLDKQNQKHTH